MNIYERLIVDHEKQRDLLARIAKTEGESKERKSLWKSLYTELEAHALAEEQVFYSVLMEEPDGTEKSRHSVAEHKEMSDIAEELDGMDMSSPGWLNRFHTLEEKVTHHLDEEEEEVFVRAKKLLSDSEAKALAKDFEVRKSAELHDAAA
ncbi:hemerythrin domain-containing protein [Parvularcula marina]|uniref:Hemerythrin domain-containing protein n=1 Tax=Parvularcula marina TaxID=2292771 RepID=A0A371RJ98_9PROT|nr:hemerythrin domain-containing protein [Parvularcula marina]RFB05530.1 hemerythrin domain-containing protein [Parvularcula marina]